MQQRAGPGPDVTLAKECNCNGLTADGSRYSGYIAGNGGPDHRFQSEPNHKPRADDDSRYVKPGRSSAWYGSSDSGNSRANAKHSSSDAGDSDACAGNHA